MPEEKKSFFNNLEPKSALIVGLVTGILSLGTLGFIILGIITLKGGLPQGAGSGAQVAYQQPTDVAPNDVAPVSAISPNMAIPIAIKLLHPFTIVVTSQ
jgi:hypothetical protein